MDETKEPVVETPNETPIAGTEETVTEPAKPETESKSVIDPAEVATLIEQSDKALAAAEKKIVSLKTKLKGIESGETVPDDNSEELRQKLASLEEEVAVLKGRETDVELSEITKLRKSNAELLASLRAKATASKALPSSNQVPLAPEEDLTKGYSREDLQFVKQIAARKNMSVTEYLKSKK